MEIILDLVLVAIIVLMVMIGIKRGLVKTCVGLISTILVIVVAIVAVNPVTNLIIVGTEWDDDVRTSLESPLADKLPNAYAKVYYFDLNEDGEKELVYEMDGIKAPFEEIFKENAVLDFINVAGLLTDSVDGLLQENVENNPEIADYKDQTNTIDFIDGVTTPLTSIIFTGICFILLLIVSRIVIALLFKLLKKLVSSLYIVHFVDKMLGGVFGLAMGALFVLVLVTVIQILSQLAFMDAISEFMSKTIVTKFLMENNFLYDFLINSINLGELMGSLGK